MNFINPIEQKNWDEMLLNSGVTSFFHTQAWARVLTETYGYRPNYLAEIDGGTLRTLVPLMEIKSLFTGKRAVSLPFTDVCSAHFDEPEHSIEALRRLRETGARRGWRYIEFRDAESVLRQPLEEKYYLHELDLNKPVDVLFKSFRNNMRRNIRKAQKLDLVIKSGRGAEMLEAYFKMHCLTRKKHGVPPQPVAFFRNIQRHIVEPGFGFVNIAYHKKKPVAGAVFFHFGKKAIYKFAASNPACQHLSANNLLIWQVIQQLRDSGVEMLDFGRSDFSNEGLRHFKRGWGAQERIIGYYRENLPEKPRRVLAAATRFTRHMSFPRRRESKNCAEVLDSRLRGNDGAKLTDSRLRGNDGSQPPAPKVASPKTGDGIFTKIFRGLPVPALRIVGRLAYPHMG